MYVGRCNLRGGVSIEPVGGGGSPAGGRAPLLDGSV